MRRAEITRNTNETAISVAINLDGTGPSTCQTGVGFFDHMLDQLARHALIDLSIQAKGALHIDDHPTVDDLSLIHISCCIRDRPLPAFTTIFNGRSAPISTKPSTRRT